MSDVEKAINEKSELVAEVRLNKHGEKALFLPKYNVRFASFAIGVENKFEVGTKFYTAPLDIEALIRDRDEWQAATVEANKRFEYAEREVAKLKAELNDTRDAYREACAQLAEVNSNET